MNECVGLLSISVNFKTVKNKESRITGMAINCEVNPSRNAVPTHYTGLYKNYAPTPLLNSMRNLSHLIT